MKRLFATLIAAIALPLAAHAQDDRPQIMILGMYHFTGGGADYVNPAVDDYLAPARQAEIEDLVEMLAEFDPTRIVVELVPESGERFNETYQRYLAGEHDLTVNERQQIGMRLAARLGHERLYAADYRTGMDFGAMMEAANENGQSDLLMRLEGLREFMTERDARLNRPEISVAQRLRADNDPEMLGLHNLYLTLALLGTNDEPIGANEMTEWWGRNLQIFAQIGRYAEPGDRVLVIYGAGHKFLLDQFFQDSVEFEWVDVLDYLPED